MKKFYHNFLRDNGYFWFFGGISVLLILISFFALGAVIHAIDTGKSATIQHGGTSLTVKDIDEEETE